MKKVFFMAIAVCLCFTGCGKVREKQEEGWKTESEKIVLEFYSWQDEKKYMTKAIEAFMEENPDIQVNCHFIPSSEYTQTISVLHNSDERGIDLFAESKPTISAVDVKRKYVMDLTEMYKVKEDTPESYKDMLEKLKIDGRLYMIPYRKSTWAVYYNKELFDAAGISYPQGEWTWREYTELARKLTRTEGNRNIYGSISYETDSLWWRTPVRAAGLENEMTEEMLDELRDAALWNYEMAYKYKAQLAYTELTDVSAYDYVSRFLRGDVAMLYCGDWVMEIIAQQAAEKQIKFSYDVAPLPKPEDKEGYMPVTTALLQISSKSKHPEEALRLAEYLAGEKGAEKLAGCGILPAWDTENVREILRKSSYAPEHIDYFFEYNNAVYTSPNVETEEALKVVNRYVSQYFLKEIDLDTAFENIRRELGERGLMKDAED